MRLIDLTRPSDNYKVITFPDGEKHLELAPLNRKEYVNIRCRITNGDDLFILMQLADILARQCVEVDTVEILYLMGMRCDRLFDINRPFSLKLVADVINRLNASDVEIAEAHSNRVLSLISNSNTLRVTNYIARTLFTQNPNLRLVAPDKGATERYVTFNFSVICKKVRDEATGALLSFEAEAKDEVKGCDLLVIDDLCDGGGTFVGLAPKLRELQPKSLSLVVTHAVQLNGIKRVAEVYDKVYITNSYKEWQNEELPSNVKVFNVNEFIF